MQEEHFDITDGSLYLFLTLLTDGEHPVSYLIPASAWQNTDTVFVHRKYEGKKSKPEYGINLSKKNIPSIEKYKLENVVEKK